MLMALLMWRSRRKVVWCWAAAACGSGASDSESLVCLVGLGKKCLVGLRFPAEERKRRRIFEMCSLCCNSLRCVGVGLEGDVLSFTRKENKCADQQSNLDVGVGLAACCEKNSWQDASCVLVNVGAAFGANGTNDCGISAKRSLLPHMVLVSGLRGGGFGLEERALKKVSAVRSLVGRRLFCWNTRKKLKIAYSSFRNYIEGTI